MLNESRITQWRNRLTWLVVVCGLISSSVIFIREWDKPTSNAQAPISIYSYGWNYALLPAPIRIDNQLYKIKSKRNYTTRLILAEDKKVVYFLLPQPEFVQSKPLQDFNLPKLVTYTCLLPDLSPPPVKFV